MRGMTHKNWLPRRLGFPLAFVEIGIAIRLGNGDLYATLHWHAAFGILLLACIAHSNWPIDSSGRFCNIYEAKDYLTELNEEYKKQKFNAVSEVIGKCWDYSVLAALLYCFLPIHGVVA